MSRFRRVTSGGIPHTPPRYNITEYPPRVAASPLSPLQDNNHDRHNHDMIII